MMQQKGSCIQYVSHTIISILGVTVKNNSTKSQNRWSTYPLLETWTMSAPPWISQSLPEESPPVFRPHNFPQPSARPKTKPPRPPSQARGPARRSRPWGTPSRGSRCLGSRPWDRRTSPRRTERSSRPPPIVAWGALTGALLVASLGTFWWNKSSVGVWGDKRKEGQLERLVSFGVGGQSKTNGFHVTI